MDGSCLSKRLLCGACILFYFICSCIILFFQLLQITTQWLKGYGQMRTIIPLPICNFDIFTPLCSMFKFVLFIFLVITLSLYWVSFIPHIIHFLLSFFIQFLLIHLQCFYAIYLHFVSSGFCSQPCCHLLVDLYLNFIWFHP